MAMAKHGDTVKVHYTGRMDDGTVFDTSVGEEPLELTIGDGEVIDGFELAIIGMRPGERKSARVTADQAFGPRDEELIQVINRSDLEADFDLEIGLEMEVERPDGYTIQATVTGLSASSVTLDANSPLAGQDLSFDIHLIEILPPPV